MRKLNVCIALGVSLATLAHAADDPIATTRSTLEKWVETRQMITRTKAAWQSDKETLNQTAQLFQKELAGVEEKISGLSTNNAEVARQWKDAETQKQKASDALNRAREFATGFEVKLKDLATRLPQPLVEDKNFKTFFNRLPADPATTKMSSAERLQIIVGLLNELDKFNNAISVFSEKQKNPKGDEVAVQTVYLGLGAAYFVNDTGDFAGTGTPGAKGWEWTSRPELGASIREVIQIYRNEHGARFVSLPAIIN